MPVRCSPRAIREKSNDPRPAPAALQWVAWTSFGLLLADRLWLYLFYVLTYGLWAEAVSILIRLAALAMLVVYAWCLAFRAGVCHVPPKDAGRRVKLTCPRCGSPEEICTGHGACTQCRLQIVILLNEGACEGCGYLLRGITSDQCPECGRPLLQPAAASPPPTDEAPPDAPITRSGLHHAKQSPPNPQTAPS